MTPTTRVARIDVQSWQEEKRLTTSNLRLVLRQMGVSNCSAVRPLRRRMRMMVSQAAKIGVMSGSGRFQTFGRVVRGGCIANLGMASQRKVLDRLGVKGAVSCYLILQHFCLRWPCSRSLPQRLFLWSC